MPQIANLVQQSTTSTGTGQLTLTQLNGRQDFHAAFGPGGTNVFFYFITHRSAAEWELGTGHMQDTATLARDTVLDSSNGGLAVNFSAGDKDVVNDIPAAYQSLLTTLASDLAGKAAASHTHSSGDLTDLAEAAQDAVGAMLADSDTVDLTYVDSTPELKADVKKQMSITSDTAGLKLSGDSASPGNSKLYGTDASGVKGWHDQPSGGGYPAWLPDAVNGWVVSESDITSGTGPFMTIASASGTGSSAGTAVTTGDAITQARCGITRLSTGTTAAGKGGRCSISGNGNLGFKNGTEYKFGAGVRIEDTPDATEDFYVFIGFRQSSSADPRNSASCGVYYDRNHTNWQLLSYSGGSASYTDSGIAFAADSWFDMGLHVTGNDTAANVTVEGFINGVSAGTITGVQNVSSLWGFNYEITKLAGTTARYMYVDYEVLKSRRT